MFLKAATIGLVMSLAKPHKAKREVTKMNGKSIALETTGIFLFIHGIKYKLYLNKICRFS